MSTFEFPYIPGGYRHIELSDFSLFASPDESSAHVEWLKQTVREVSDALRSFLNFCPKRRLAVCCYRSNQEACECLDRKIDSTMALAPFDDNSKGLIAIQSPEANRRNGDSDRMKRILAHEMAHQFVSEISNSKKVLGDGNVNRIVPAWLDEGFAVVVSRLVWNDITPLKESIELFNNCTELMTFGELNWHLDDLWSKLRDKAFMCSTAAVYSLVQETSVDYVFRNLNMISGKYDNDDVCAPDKFRKELPL